MYSRFMLFRPEGGDPGSNGAAQPALAGQHDAQIVVMPETGAANDNRSAVERATEQYRQRLADTGTALPTPPGTQPRRADGTFRPAPATGAPPEGETDEQRVMRESQEAEATRQRELREATETPEQRAAREAAERGAPEAPQEETRTPEEVAADAAAAAERVVTLRLNDEETPIEFDDPAVAAQFREALQIADQADEIVQRAEREIEEVLLVREAVTIDPVGFVLDEIGTDAPAVEHLVLSLLTRPEHAPLLDKLKGIVGDPNKLALTAAEQRAARAEYRDEAQHRVTEARAVSQNLKQVNSVVRAIAAEVPDEVRGVATQDMLADLKAYAIRNNLHTLPPEDIPMILARRLTALRVDPVHAAKLANEAINRPPSRASARGVAPARVKSAQRKEPASAASVPAGSPAKKTGSAFVASAERRKAAAIPGGGAGAPGAPATLVPPLNPDGSKMTIEQTTAWHRSRLQKGVKSY